MPDDRKYRQRGYQDDDRRGRGGPPGDHSRPRPRPEPHDPRMPRDPRVPNMPGFREVVRCARCGSIDTVGIGPESDCKKCGAALHSCAQCESFDPGAVYECRQTIPVRISPKDGKNTCTLFSPRIQVERETGSTPATSKSSSGAKKAFDDLFNF
jgi:hypothetical protein